MKMCALIVVLIILLLPNNASCSSFDEWSTQDIALEVIWQGVNFLDWGTTSDGVSMPNKYRENNPILGDHPNREALGLYMGLGALAHLGITHILPAKYRPYFQAVTIAASGACVINNFSIGLNLRF